MVADWLLIAAVVGGVIAVFYAIGEIIDNLTDYWRAYRDND